MSGPMWRPDPKHSHTEGHTADLWIVGEGPDWESVLASMLESLYSVVSEVFEIGGPAEGEISVQGASPEQALVRFLSEALYLLEGEDTIVLRPRIELRHEADRTFISARGPSFKFSIPERTGVEVKAVTYHEANIGSTPSGGCSARVLIDI